MDVRFFYDLGSPYAFLTAERIDDAFDPGVEVEWVPVLLGAIHKATGRSSWAETAARAGGIAEVERRADERDLPPLVWPEVWPNNGLTAMRVAALAHREGAGRAFARSAFFEQFLLGHALSESAHIAAAAERAGLDADQALAAAGEQSVKDALRDNTESAIALGVIGVPSVAVGASVLWGDDRLAEAVALTRPPSATAQVDAQ